MRAHTLFGAPTAVLVLSIAACGDQPVAPPDMAIPGPLQSVTENGWQDFDRPMHTCFEPVYIEGRVHTVLTFQENANRVSFSWHVRFTGTGTGEFSGGLYHLNEAFAGSQNLGTDPEYPHVINIKDHVRLIGQGRLPDIHGQARFHLTINANGEGVVAFVDDSFECGQTKGKGRTLVVNVTDDVDDGRCTKGHCSLREAILAANLLPGRNTVAFDIPGPTPHTIPPTSPLPWLISGAVIDGTTEPDYTGTPVVELQGAFAGDAPALSIVGGNTTVMGLAIHGFRQGVWLAWNGGNEVLGNHIGADVTGTAAPGNHGEGIFIDQSPDNVIGGPSPGEGNVVSGNHGNGVMILGGGSHGNRVQGNIIGADITGTATLPNVTGIFMEAPGNLIGGWDAGAGNLVSGNSDFGIHMVHSPDNTIQGNLVGTDITGTAPLGNGFAGIQIENSPGNVIGGTVPGARNIVSANGFGFEHPLDGIVLAGPETHGTVVQGNYIGTDVTGTVDLGNANAGVMLGGSHDNTVGGTVPGAGNLISGNVEGVTFVETGNTSVQGNLIGTDVTGTVALGNETGVLLLSGGNVIGGGDPAARNLISGNNGDAIRLEHEAGGNQISGNYVGTDVTGTAALGNGGRGVNLINAHGNTVGGGGPGEGNVFSANASGVAIVAGASGNAVVGNFIGTDATGTSPMGNVRAGIFVATGAGGNGIGGRPDGMGNVIAFNGLAGIRLGFTAGPGNAIERNSVFDNATLGIDLGSGGVTPNDLGDTDVGANDGQNFPVLATADGFGVTGTLNSTPDTEFWIEFFVNDACDPLGYGEGRTYLGAMPVGTDSFGDAGFAFPGVAPPGSLVTATATNSGGSTSEFSACVPAT